MILKLYDESTADSRYVYLTNMVKEYSNYNGVGLSIPSGVVRVAAPATAIYTHVEFDYNGCTVIGKINSISYVNAGTIDLYYDMDYIKSYFADNGLSNVKGYIVRSSTKYDEYLKDTVLPLQNKVSLNRESGASFNYSDGKWCIVVKNASTDSGQYNGIRLYFMDKNDLMTTLHAIQHSATAQVFKSQILKIYWVPEFSNLSIASHLEVTQVFWLYDDYKENNYINIIEAGNYYYTEMPTPDTATFYKNTDLHIIVDNYLDMTPNSQYSLYIPFIGNINLDVNSLPTAISQGHHVVNPIVQYYIDLTSGSISARILNHVGTQTAYAELPTIDLSVSTGEAERYNIEFNAMSKSVLALASGNVAAAAGIGIDFVGSMARNAHTPVNTGGVTSNSSMYHLYFEYTVLQYKPTIPFTEYVALYGHLANKLITVNTMPDNNELMTLDVQELSGSVLFRDRTIAALNNSQLIFN